MPTSSIKIVAKYHMAYKKMKRANGWTKILEKPVSEYKSPRKRTAHKDRSPLADLEKSDGGHVVSPSSSRNASHHCQ